MQIKVNYKGVFELPKHETDLSAGLDIRADFSGIESREDVKVFDGAFAFDNWSKEQKITLPPHSRALIPTRIFIELPAGYEAQIRPRSGLALKQGIIVVNSPGTVDSDYRGTIGVILCNLGNKKFPIKRFDRIAQIVFQKVEHPNINVTDVKQETTRNEGGFGSTGSN